MSQEKSPINTGNGRTLCEKRGIRVRGVIIIIVPVIVRCGTTAFSRSPPTSVVPQRTITGYNTDYNNNYNACTVGNADTAFHVKSVHSPY